MAEVKKRRVLKRDQDEIASYIQDEWTTRHNCKKREGHKRIWDEVDRQIRMEAPTVMNKSGNPAEDWMNAIQLGALANASEVSVSDAKRLAFPIDRRWFTPHTLAEGAIERSEQRTADNLLRNLMVQQMKDFGFKGRIKLALKEIYHHGGVVATVEKQCMLHHHNGSRREKLTAPVWITHSMRRSYPDPSPAIQGTEMYYQGSMIIESWMPMSKAKRVKGWSNRDKLRESKKFKDHIHLLTYYGDLTISRQDGDIWTPNRKTLVSDGLFLFSEVNETPYSPVIYTGYERDDVTDPYYTSPLIRIAPTGKFTTEMANRTMDAVQLKVNPPDQYDALDSHLAANGGPDLSPGAHNKTRGGKGIAIIDIGSETATTGLAATQWGMSEIEKATKTNAPRGAVAPGTEVTATEAVKEEQRSEAPKVEFVSTFEDQALLPYLYMHHDLNKLHLESYEFYNDDPRTADFLRASKSDLPKKTKFEIVGSRELLGEEQRTARVINTAQIAAGIPQIAAQTDWAEVSMMLWESTRVKDPGRFVIEQEDDKLPREAFEQAAQQAQQIVQELQQQLQEVGQKLAQAEAQVQADKAEKAKLRTDINSLEEQAKIQRQLEQAKDELEALQREIEAQQGQGVEVARQQTQAQVGALEQATRTAQQAIDQVAGDMDEERKDREERNKKILDFIEKNGSEPMKKLARDLK